MSTPQHYVAAHTAGYTGFRDMIVSDAQAWLASNPGTHATKELSEALWPSRFATGHDVEIRKRMVDVLLKCAEDKKHLAGYARRGPVSGQSYGKPRRPWLWEAPRQQELCPISGLPERIFMKPVQFVATAEDIANVLSTMPGGEYLSGAQKLGMARGLLEQFSITTGV